MVELVLLVLIVMSALNKGREVITASLFVIGFAHYILSSYLEFAGYSYYLSSAAACMIAIVYLTHQQIKNELHIDLSLIFWIGILFNGLGWIAYEFYLEPLSYNVAFAVLYMGLIIRLLVRKHTDGLGGDITYSNRISAVLHSVMQICGNDKEGKA